MALKTKLVDEFNTISNMGMLNKKLPDFIAQNINEKFIIRDYQLEAINRLNFYLNNKNYSNIKNKHLLFNMATGSGKTLIMACAILTLYQKGYRNFLFFVNSNNVLTKTINNFTNSSYSKYLFKKKIFLNNTFTQVKNVKNFESKNNNINILFTTIQKLHSDMSNFKENNLTLSQFERDKTVIISDEAHHIQSKTKKNLFNDASSWENTVEKINQINPESILLEFTATVDFQDDQINKKYFDKLLIKYDLAEFRNDGFSKEINIAQSDITEKMRILQAVIINQYRQDIALKNKINLKPIILFKAQKTIDESFKNKQKFCDLINSLNEQHIKDLKNKTKLELLHNALKFYKENNTTLPNLIKRIKINFSENKLINVNEIDLDKKNIKRIDRKETHFQQNLLNELEDKDNQIRVIFAVNKLNEGWDVLNLFDIVRLYSSRDSATKIGKTTLSEAQLIGRGARYFPFEIENYNSKYQRKFDHDLNNELRVLEELHYHSVKDNKYIYDLRRALIEKGLINSTTIKKEIKIKETFKKTQIYNSGVIFLNKRIKNNNEKNISLEKAGFSKKNITYEIFTGSSNIQKLISEDSIKEQDNNIKNNTFTLRLAEIEQNIIINSIYKNSFFSFQNLKKFFPKLSSVDDFINGKNYLGNLEINFKGNINNKSEIKKKDIYNSLLILLDEIKNELITKSTDYIGSKNFKPYLIKNIFKDKELNLSSLSERFDGQENFLNDKDWYIYHANYGTSEEKSFVEMFSTQLEVLQKKFEQIYLLRNEQFFKIYNFDDGRAFQPDYLIYAQDKKYENLYIQVFVEPKGKFLKEFDKWKEDFLKSITKNFGKDFFKFSNNRKFKILGLPFYNNEDENEFKNILLDQL